MTETAISNEFAISRAVSQRHATLMEAAHDLVPVLRERAPRAEELRRLPEETERVLHDRGLFRILQPHAVGGAELDYVALVDFSDVIARGCASTAWTLANLASHHWMLAMFPKAAQDRIWNADADALIASSFIFPSGKARRVEGGYLLSGRWQFSSGVDSSRWNMLAGVVAAEDETVAPEYRVFILPSSDYETIDTWHAAGLKGTGSNDVTCQDVFVDEDMSVAVADLKGGPTPGSAVNPSPLYQIPVFALFPFVLSGVGLGNAHAAVSDYIAASGRRASRYNATRVADLQSTQIHIGEATAKVDAARRIMRSICVEAMADAAQGRVPSLLEKTRFRRDGAYAVGLCTEAVDLVFAASGAGALFMRNADQRQFRDAHAIAAHIAFSSDMAASSYGRIALGLEPDNPTL